MAEAKEKHSVDEQWPSLIQRVEAMESVIELLLETLAGLSDEELNNFKEVLWRQICFNKRLSYIPWRRLMAADMQDIVFLMVETYGRESVEMTKKVLKVMNRTDLVQRLSDSSSGPKKKHSVDERLSALIHKVATKTAVKQLLLETLKDLSGRECNTFQHLLQFKFFQRRLPCIPWEQWEEINSAGALANVMVEVCGQQSVAVTKEVLTDMNRTDLVQRLSETCPGPEAAGSSAEAVGVKTTEKKEQFVEEHWPVLIQKVEAMESVIELLLETLAGLSDEELNNFKEVLLRQIYFNKRLSYIPWRLLMAADMQDIVFLMVETYGRESVETTKEVLKEMNRTDLVQRLSDSSSGPKKKHSVDEQLSALIHKVATMAAVKELLLETLNDFSREELKKFKKVLQVIVHHKGLRNVSLTLTHTGARIVDLMVQTYGLQSVEFTWEALKEMNRTDLMQRLLKPSSGLREKHHVDEHRPALWEREAAMAAVKQILLETLKDLSQKELMKFNHLLHLTYFQKSLPQISWHHLEWVDSKETVDLMVKNHGQQSVEVTKEVFMDMNRTDLVERLSEASSGLKEKHRSELFQKLWETLKDLSYGELEDFKELLQRTNMKKGRPTIPRYRMKMANRVEIVELMEEIYGQQSVEVTGDILKQMNRTDLVQRWSDISSGSKGPSRSLKLEGCGSVMDSSDWTKLEPEVNSTDAAEAPNYSLQSEAGNFECSVSGLRWVCKEKVSFKYQFFSWEEPMERMESIKYMPAGPLMDITVIAGKLEEVHLPHWICIDDNPKILDKFAVLHIDDCGDVVEKVSEVTSSHVKLSEPVFSPRGVLMKVGFPVKIYCNLLIYKTDTAFLTLHVYLIPLDPGLQQTMDKRELSNGYKIIRKPHPEKSLKMHDRFILTADVDSAEICPEKLKLRYESRNPNFFEMFIENPERNFTLKLTRQNERQPVWTCVIRKGEYQSTGHIQGEYFVDKHQCDLIERVNNIGPILDELLRQGVIQQEDYDTISATQTTQEKVRKLYRGPLKAGGQKSKNIFYNILVEKEKYLVDDLTEKES